MTMDTTEKKNTQKLSGSYASSREQDIEQLAHAPTGAPMEGRHWAFLLLSGLVLPVLILLWGWA